MRQQAFCRTGITRERGDPHAQSDMRLVPIQQIRLGYTLQQFVADLFDICIAVDVMHDDGKFVISQPADKMACPQAGVDASAGTHQQQVACGLAMNEFLERTQYAGKGTLPGCLNNAWLYLFFIMIVRS